MAERLFEPLVADEYAAVTLTPAEMTVAVRQFRSDLDQLSRDARQLAPVARQYGMTLDALIALDARKPEGSRWFLSVLEFGLGVGTRNSDQISSAGKNVLQETQTLWDWAQEVRRTAQGIDTARMELLQLVPQFSGATANSPMISWTYSEKKPGFFALDKVHRVHLTNVSERDLHDCVVSIRLSNAAGRSAHNVHFVRNWARGEKLYAKYVSSSEFEKTVPDVSRIDVTFWSREGVSSRVEMQRPKYGWQSFN